VITAIAVGVAVIAVAYAGFRRDIDWAFTRAPQHRRPSPVADSKLNRLGVLLSRARGRRSALSLRDETEDIRPYTVEDRPTIHPARQRADEGAERHLVPVAIHHLGDRRRMEGPTSPAENLGGLVRRWTVLQHRGAAPSPATHAGTRSRRCFIDNLREQRLRCSQFRSQPGNLPLLRLDDREKVPFGHRGSIVAETFP